MVERETYAFASPRYCLNCRPQKAQIVKPGRKAKPRPHLTILNEKVS